jgi:hypothetical protein
MLNFEDNFFLGLQVTQMTQIGGGPDPETPDVGTASSSVNGGSGIQGGQRSLFKNRPKWDPAHFSSKLVHDFYRGKKVGQKFGLLLYFSEKKTAQRKQSPTRRKFHQSGHPGIAVKGDFYLL